MFPVRVPRGWFDRSRPEADDALLRQAIPSPEELLPDGEGRVDPVGERSLKPHPWLVRKHDDRMLLLLTRRCHLYCRYCFRRNDHGGPEDPSREELDEALALARASGARELILSGGDPLAVRDDTLFRVLDAVRPEVPVVRIHTRAPITAPRRVTDELVRGLRERAPVWVLVHANHPRELTGDVVDALGRLVDAGLPVLNQSVLLAGVNDDVDVLAELSERLVELRVFPYYLHHTDAALGNAAFRVDAERGLALHDALARRVSGVALPRYVVDPPDGSGKIGVLQAVQDGILSRRS
ncbi:MAG: KamA family radical SAM protein [Proteobacteria bacterium]|nr:KamA family radical SAM protein [Pseudomonadota bacterium]MCP4920225.1 KamA family radical SAM protein [Pseudomonadota bacterium]